MAIIDLANLPNKTSATLTGTEQIFLNDSGVAKDVTVAELKNEFKEDFAAPSGASLVGYMPAGVGAAATTTEEFLHRTKSLKSFIPVLHNPATTDTSPYIQQALNETPVGWKLIFDVPGTVLLDTSRSRCVVRGTNQISAAFVATKSINIEGLPACKLKVKDFSTAWMNFIAGDSVCVLLINSSNVTVSGLDIDCNSNNHYELSGAYKYWETGPTDKRPIDGIIACPTRGSANLTNIRVKENTIDNCLCGVGFFGNLPSLTDSDFLAGTSQINLVKGCFAENNTVKNHRGNAILFNEGVQSCRSFNNLSVNGMYHAFRIYAAVLDSDSVKDRQIIIEDEIIARYNSITNGYWRTDNTGDATGFKILRLGFSLSSGWNYSSGLHNVKNCKLAGASGYVKRSASHATYFSTSNAPQGVEIVTQFPGLTVDDGVFVGYPKGMLITRSTPFNGKVFPATKITNNQFSDTLGDGISVGGVASVDIDSNTFDTIGTNSVITSGITSSLGDINITNNAFRNKTAGGSIFGVYLVGSADSAFGIKTSGNKFDSTYTAGLRYSQAAASTPKVAFEGDKELIVYNGGWTHSTKNYGATGLSESYVLYGNGTVTLTLLVSGLAKSSNIIATLASGAWPKYPVAGLLTCNDTPYASYPVLVNTNGTVTVVAVAAGTALPDNLAMTLTYQI